MPSDTNHCSSVVERTWTTHNTHTHARRERERERERRERETRRIVHDNVSFRHPHVVDSIALRAIFGAGRYPTLCRTEKGGIKGKTWVCDV